MTTLFRTGVVALGILIAAPFASALDLTTFQTALNTARGQNGLGGLQANAALIQAAQGHADDMAVNGYFNHRGRDGSTPGRRIKAAGYCWLKSSENIAMGPQTEAQAMQMWMDSAPHRANILAADVAEYGVAQSGTIWVMVVARPC